MADAITTSIEANATSGVQSQSADGVSETKRSLTDQIAAKKYLDANANVSAIEAGTHFFSRVRMVPPGAGGSNVSIDY